MYQYEARILFHETDPAGVLFFAHLFTRAHEAYERYMAERVQGLKEILQEGRLVLPLVHAEADYLHPLHHEDRVGIMLEVLELGTHSFTLGYEFFVGDALCARVRTVHVAVATGTRRPVSLPGDWRTALAVDAVSGGGQ